MKGTRSKGLPACSEGGGQAARAVGYGFEAAEIEGVEAVVARDKVGEGEWLQGEDKKVPGSGGGFQKGCRAAGWRREGGQAARAVGYGVKAAEIEDVEAMVARDKLGEGGGCKGKVRKGRVQAAG